MSSPTRSRPARRHRTHAKPAVRRPDRPAPVSALDAALTASQQLPAPPPRTFAQLGLPNAVVSVLARRGIQEPFAIQARALPDALAGRDVLARAQTGSGKTLAFGLPMLTRLAGDSSARRPQAPRGLILVPTRELARQVADALEPISTVLGLRVTTVFGGASMGKQIEALRRGVDVVVATPGRLMDLMERRSVRLDAVEIAVIDEADHMADLGFLPAVTKILDTTPSGRQCLLFSATLDRGVDKLVARYLTDPAIHAVALGLRVDRADGPPGLRARPRREGRRRGADRRPARRGRCSSSVPSTAPTGSPSSSSGRASTPPRSTATSTRASGSARSTASRAAATGFWSRPMSPPAACTSTTSTWSCTSTRRTTTRTTCTAPAAPPAPARAARSSPWSSRTRPPTSPESTPRPRSSPTARTSAPTTPPSNA